MNYVMKIEKLLKMMILTSSILISCQKDPPIEPYYPDYVQLKVGNYWVYERWKIDDYGNEFKYAERDCVYIEKDTIINNEKYYHKKGILMGLPVNSFERDSSGYLVNNLGEILFSANNFTDTLNIKCTGIHYFIYKMAKENSPQSLPAGDFVSLIYKGIFYVYCKFPPEPSEPCSFFPPETNNFYADKVGLVKSVNAGDFEYCYKMESRLLRYKVE